ncbi:type II secretion system F family protein [Serratia proteamaculans]|uniref:type II secretion system F family protein n=1 Tax=Serratia proteamaculans TaxID=28151 RepID=UPI001C55D406|nr:type II secretion system F family protein [Serratia proteamaculans]WEO91652.1 type II secretion system F family protein [Serratia proteamaculans]
MMDWIYSFIFIFGVYLIAVTLIQQQKVMRQKKIIEHTTDETGKKMMAKIDYRALIIHNDRWLRFLDNLDKKLEIKLRICFCMGLLMLALKLVGIFPVSMRALAMLLLLVFVLIIIVPGLLLKPAITTRIKRMLDALPYFIDLIAVCVQSGMTVESALKYIGERFDDMDCNLASLIKLVVKKAEVSGLEDSLAELYRSMDMTEMRMFCATLQQSVHYGTSLYENLMELSKDIRELQLLITEEKIGKLSAKMSVPLILFIMFPITVLIAAPGILRIMKHAML